MVPRFAVLAGDNVHVFCHDYAIWQMDSKIRYAYCHIAHSLCEVDGKLYAIGGYPIANAEGLKTVEIYDPETDTWEQKTEMPGPRFGGAAVIIGQKIYVIGGAMGYDAQSVVEVYDPVSDTWSTGTSLPEPRIGSASTIKGKIYFTGGMLTVTPPHPAVAWVEEYTPVQ